MMINNNLYVVGRKSYLHNSITVFGVFPNEHLAYKFYSVFGGFSSIFVVGQSQIKFSDCEIEIPFGSKEIK